MTQEEFDQLLTWLDADRNQAGEKYEEIRRSLIKILRWRGCRHAEELADETFNRVAGKIAQVTPGYRGNPAIYCYGVARIVAHEYLRKGLAPEIDLATMKIAAQLPEDTTEKDSQLDCLDTCLRKLSSENRDLILLYYQREKQAKIDFRKELADQLGIGMNAFRVRIHRIRTEVEQCILECLGCGANSE
jgi:RNA polymerase sigma factor (sigma-70 family)